MSNPTYRSDIDGLRALAVLLVVIYHAGINIPGGFVGVDVFFVISGYLITGIIYREVQEGRFSFATFYKRRIKRLLPAFVVVAVGTTLLIRWFMLPEEFENYAKSLQNAILGISNFYFWKETQGYFASDAEMLPLIHTWSLSVEEQFYVVWPLLILGLASVQKVFKHPKYFIFGVFIVALLVSEYMARFSPHAAYYLLPARAFELMVGGVLAVNQDKMPKLSLNQGHMISGIGLALILVSAFTLSRESFFPGINALWPCLGAALILWVGMSQPTAFVNRVFSTKPVVLIGLISYSVYLWHWPPIAIAHYLNIELTLFISLSIIALSLILGWLTWKYVEGTTRHITWSFPKVFVVMFLVPLLTIVGFYKYVRSGDGRPERLPDLVQTLYSKAENDKSATLFGNCHNGQVPFKDHGECLFGAKDSKSPDFILLGDSHGNAAHGFFEVLAEDANLTGLEVTRSGSPFFPETQRFLLEKNGEVKKHDEKYEAYINNLVKHFKNGYDGFVVMGGRWALHLNREKVTYEPGFEAAFEQSLAFFRAQKIKVFVFLSVPEYDQDISIRCQALDLLESELVDTGENCTEGTQTTAISEFMKRQHQVAEFMLSMKNKYPEIAFIDPKDVLCNDEGCTATLDNYVIYNDTDHLNYTGSKILGEHYLKAFGNPLLNHDRLPGIRDVWR